MRRIFVLLVIGVSFVISQARAVDNQSLWAQAATFYDNGQYDAAIENYSELLKRDFVNAALYYNLGNCYFKKGDIGLAVVAYRRSLLLDDAFVQAKNNLEYARSFNIDQIQAEKRGFVTDIWNSFARLLTINGYLLLFSIAWWTGALICALVIVKRGASTWLYYLLLIALATAILSASFATKRAYESRVVRWGVLIAQTSEIREGPGEEFEKIAVTHEGLEFKILRERENSYLIELGNGLKGWLEKKIVLEI